jgi:hypothetical protein
MQEIGAGFAFVGSQHRLEVDGEEFFIDLLFFHVELNCYVVIELGKFRPENAGQLNVYVVDAQLRRDHHNPAIGLVLCAGPNETVARYTLQGMNRPIGVSSYAAGRRADATALPSPERLAEAVSAIVARHPEIGTVTGDASDACTDQGPSSAPFIAAPGLTM